MRSILEQYAPEKLGEVKSLMREYKGREKDLINWLWNLHRRP